VIFGGAGVQFLVAVHVGAMGGSFEPNVATTANYLAFVSLVIWTDYFGRLEGGDILSINQSPTTVQVEKKNTAENMISRVRTSDA